MLRRPFHADHPYGKRYYPAYMIHNDHGLGYKELCKVLHAWYTHLSWFVIEGFLQHGKTWKEKQKICRSSRGMSCKFVWKLSRFGKYKECVSLWPRRGLSKVIFFFLKVIRLNFLWILYSAQEEIAKNILETMNQCYSSTAETNGNGSIMQSAPLVYRVI